MDSNKTYILTFEWSESPYHEGTYSVFLSYHTNSRRWALSASRNPSGERLSWKIGDGNEEQREIAIELLRKSYDRGALTFDLIADNGPFEISLKDFIAPKIRMVETNEPIEAPKQVCEYCRYLKRPQGFAGNMGRIFDCSRGNWTDRERGISETRPSAGRSPKLDFTCQEFAPAHKKREETYY